MTRNDSTAMTLSPPPLRYSTLSSIRTPLLSASPHPTFALPPGMPGGQKVALFRSFWSLRFPQGMCRNIERPPLHWHTCITNATLDLDPEGVSITTTDLR